MTQSDEYIVVTESRNLDSGDSDPDIAPRDEREDASLQALESNGVSILKNDDIRVGDASHDDFSRELMDEGGIEIVPNDEEEESFL